MRESFGRREELRERKEKKERFPGDNGGGVTPVSIPNTEVKSSCADGTAYSFRGRVGHCQDIGEEREEKFLSFFFTSYFDIFTGEMILSKYDALWNYIQKNGNESFKLTFEEIEKIIGIPIDHSFLKYKKELVEYGYQLGKISMKEQTVIFTKID